MNEPTVLDYVKAKLKFWEKTDLHFPAPAEASQLAEIADSSGVPQDALADSTLAEERESVHFPWLAVLPVVLALIGQSFLEPPSQAVMPAVFFYLAAAGTLVLAFMRGDLQLAERAPTRTQEDTQQFRMGEALIGVPVALLAFLLLGNNHFTVVNVALWMTALGLFLAAFLQYEALPNLPEKLRSAWQALRRPGVVWNIRISRWTLLVMAVLVVVGFFRFYNIEGIPIDMVSDHAEKLLDMNDLVNGNTWIFFERNTGREPLQFYWTALVMALFNLDVSFFSLKFATVLTGLIVLYYTYRLGCLIGNRWVGLFSLLFVGVAYWSNIISRIALRFPLYPLFVAPLLFHLIRGLRNGTRNDFIWAGIWLGIGLNGYTSSRIVPLLVVVAVAIYLLHRQSRGYRAQALFDFLLIVLMAIVICLPLFRYGLEHPNAILFRSFTRLGTLERELPGSPLMIFFSNFWAAITMFFYNNGSIWVHSIPYRPALDIVMAALFFSGIILLLVRYIRRHAWEDLLLLVSIPILLLPSILSLAFPGENPSLNRTSGAYVPVLVIAALAFEAMLRGLIQHLPARSGRNFATVVALVVLTWTIANNYNLFFVQYAQNYRQNAWNTKEIGEVARDFAGLAGTYDTYYVVGFPYWIDSRQVAIFAGHIERDPAVLPEQLADTTADPRMKMFLLKPEDTASLDTLRQLYPQGRAELHKSPQDQKDFMIFLAPASIEASQ